MAAGLEAATTATEWLRNLAIVGGVGLAWWQVTSWKREKRASKLAEFGEELFAAAFQFSDAMSVVRNPHGMGPPDGEEDDGTFDYRRRLDEIFSQNDLNQELRKLQVRNRALLGDEEIDDALQSIFAARVRVMTALAGKIRNMRRARTIGSEEFMSEREHMRDEQYDEVIWEDYAEVDPIKSMLEPALKAIELAVVPLIRFEKQK